MRRYLADPGGRSAAASGVVIMTLAVFFADAYPVAWIALGAVWSSVTALTVWSVHRRAVG